ncbi:MAG: DUF4271 domain-containing protein [Cyclobacteriaceae bacterium]|nr:DUF4271 domain-containing protein [Cyclobacteriaceae bacterium]
MISLVMLLVLSSPVQVADLREMWLVLDGKEYRHPEANEGEKLRTIYFPLDARKYGGLSLEFEVLDRGHVFINGKLLGPIQRETRFSIDSLREAFGDRLWVAVHAPGLLHTLTARVVAYAELPGSSVPLMMPRPPTYFRDYAILMALCLVGFFVLLYRSNPQLTLDYFSFSKIFSSSERNETQLASRITSSENLLFYVFSALLTGFLLSAILYSSGPFFPAARALSFASLGGSLLVGIKLSGFILLLLAAKLVIVLIFSTLFNFRETVSFQFFNFLRFVLFTSVVLAVLSLFLFVFRASSPRWYEQLVVVALALLTLGSGVVLMKLLRKSRLSFFHLFSYLCISEFIPLVILFKIFF